MILGEHLVREALNDEPPTKGALLSQLPQSLSELPDLPKLPRLDSYELLSYLTYVSISLDERAVAHFLQPTMVAMNVTAKAGGQFGSFSRYCATALKVLTA